MKEKEYDRIVAFLGLGKGFFGIGKTEMKEAIKWIEDIKQFLIRFQEYFKLENVTIDDLHYILLKHKKFILDKVMIDEIGNKE